jgi:DnaK suppressor protein
VNSNEISNFEEILNERKTQIEKNLQGVSDEIRAINTQDLHDEGDYATANIDSVVENAIGTQQERELKEILYSLAKIKAGDYGICEMCEEDIAIARLEVKPHAKYCIDCREIAEKNNKV